MNFDTRDPKAMLKIDHGCIEGLPCTPPAAELYNDAGSNGGGSGSGSAIPDVKPHLLPSNDGTTIDVGSSVGFILVITFLSILSLCVCCMNCRLRRQLKNSAIGEEDDGEMEDVGVDGQFDYQGGLLENEQRTEDEVEMDNKADQMEDSQESTSLLHDHHNDNV